MRAVIVKIKNMTQYRLEKESGIQHGTMNSIMSARNKGIELNTVMMIAAGFNMPVIEFLDDPIFESENLEIEWLFGVSVRLFRDF